VTKKHFILSDENLWNNFLAGDEDAFEKIYENSISDLFTYGRKFSQDQELVKDCIQDLFITLHQTRSRIGKTKKILPYLMISLKRIIIKKLKEQNLSKRIDFENLPFQFLLEEGPEVIKDEHEEDIVQKAMNLLAPRQQEAIYLKYVLGLDYEELGKVLNLNYQTSRNLVYLGLQKLRDKLKR
jgi:RNA polymerase sigma factor (sigma-70 family)